MSLSKYKAGECRERKGRVDMRERESRGSWGRAV